MLENRMADALLGAWMHGTDLNETLPEWVKQDLHEKATAVFKILADALRDIDDIPMTYMHPDPLKYAKNVIESMRAVARGAITKASNLKM